MPNIAPCCLTRRRRRDEVAGPCTPPPTHPEIPPHFTPDFGQAWVRLALALVIGSIGSVGMWSVVVVLPVVQAEFGATRGAISLAFTLTMLGFGLGGVATGRITDRFGIVVAMGLSIAFLGLAYVARRAFDHAVAIHRGAFPDRTGYLGDLRPANGGGLALVRTLSRTRRHHRRQRQLYRRHDLAAAGQLGDPVGRLAHHLHRDRDFLRADDDDGAAALRAQIGAESRRSHANAPPPRIDLRLSTNTLTVMLCIASISCCVAMAMPQVHIVAYCGDLGYGVARGAEMLSLMMAFGVVSRIGSGFLADKIGGIRTLLIGSVAQGFALLFYLFFDGLTSLYIISAMFGLFQGGIVPSYAIIVREAMPAQRSGDPGRHRDFRLRVRHVIRRLGVRRDLRCVRLLRRGVPQRAAWNALNIAIMVALLIRARSRLAMA